MKGIKMGLSDLCMARRPQRGFTCAAGVSLTLFLAACTSAHPARPVSSTFHFLPAAKVMRRVPVPASLSNGAKGMARLLYSKTMGSAPTDAELTDSVNQAISELMKQIAPGATNSDTVYYELFDNLGMFMHLVEQTVQLTAQKHNKSISPKAMIGALKEALSSGSGQRIYKSLSEGYKPHDAHDPHDPNQMVGPVFFTDSKSDSTRPLLVSYSNLLVNHTFYPQPFLYTIRFANLKAANVGPATTITITDNLDAARLDISTLRLGLIALENSAPNGKMALCQVTPPFAAIGPGGVVFPIPSADPLVPTPIVKVTLKNMGGQIQQITWTFPSPNCNLVAGSEGSVSFFISPRDTTHPATNATIFNEGAGITFQGANGPLPRIPTNTWLP